MPREPYTVDLANASLPLVRAIVSDVVQLDAAVRIATEDYRALKQRRSPSQEALNGARRELGELVAARDECEDELAQLGVRLGDAERGICDFPAVLDDAPVYLCWELGEDRVEYWHPRDGGYAQRLPLPVPVHAD